MTHEELGEQSPHIVSEVSSGNCHEKPQMLGLLDKTLSQLLKIHSKTKGNHVWRSNGDWELCVSKYRTSTTFFNTKKKNKQNFWSWNYNNWNENFMIGCQQIIWTARRNDQQAWRQVNWDYPVWEIRKKEKWTELRTCEIASDISTCT